jgi:prolyl-tRNA synthetase
MRAVYLDRDGKEKTMIMGCYGIGIGRTVAACIEQNFDVNGIIWPMPLAPYQVIVTPVNINETDLLRASENIYNQLLACGVETILDDRDERAGVKFKDADLIGIPLRIVVGPKNLKEGQVELKVRKTGESRLYKTGDIVREVQSIIAAEFKEAS